jgi:tRNA modification GTPase
MSISSSISSSTLSEDTIGAIATAVVPEAGSVAIVRLSGPDALAVATALMPALRSPQARPLESHRVYYGWIKDPKTQEAVDEVLMLYMARSRSFTREEVVEFHCHGGIVPVQRVLQLCLHQGVRLARPGEFTLRAFLNGRIDLTQAESVAQLVGACSPQAAQVALSGLQGHLARPIETLRSHCLDLLAEIEARIDFEEDLPSLDELSIRQQIQAMQVEVAGLLATADRGELLRSGLKVAIVGRPNVGKSSLLNLWSQTERAIVTDLPGTTRDTVDTHLVVQGIPVQVIDTAGIRESGDIVEQMGIERSRKAASQADLILLVVDYSQGWTPEDAAIYQEVASGMVVLVANKTDLNLNKAPTLQSFPEHLGNLVKISTLRDPQDSIARLEQAILKQVGAGLTAANMDIAINQRQQEALLRVQESLERVQETMTEKLPLDFWTIDLREAATTLGQITGQEVTEPILDRIFSRFCLGK